MDEQRFNWDNIEVGNYQLDHSENFFVKKHYSHEKIIEDFEFVNVQMDTVSVDDKENINENQITSPADVKMETITDGNNDTFPPLEETHNIPADVKDEICSPESINVIPSSFASNDDVCDDVLKETKEEVFDVTAVVKRPLNLVHQWSAVKHVVNSKTGAISKQPQLAPHAYQFKDMYKRKKEEAIRQREQEERKMREFHSKPAPKFTFKERRPLTHIITVPKTPNVLKKTRENQETRKTKIEESKQPPRFVAGPPPTVVHAKPFVPKKVVTVLDVRPFNLKSEKRALERKRFDQAMEEKRKQLEIEEDERRKREEEQIKQLRKTREFKARPNPFK